MQLMTYICLLNYSNHQCWSQACTVGMALVTKCVVEAEQVFTVHFAVIAL